MKHGAASNQSRVGIVLCDCGGTLTGRLDFDRLRRELAAQPGVAAVRQCTAFCRPAECARVTRQLAGRGCRRLAVAACRREIYTPALAAAMARARLRPGLTAEANIREHCAWVHPDCGAATVKALDLAAAAARRAALVTPAPTRSTRVLTNVVVLGGGPAGLQAAVSLSGLGHAVTLVSRDRLPGGCAAKCPSLFGYLDEDAAAAERMLRDGLDDLTRQMAADRRIRRLPGATLSTLEGSAGRFELTLAAGGRERRLRAGAVVLAVGDLAALPLAGAQAPGPVLDLAGLAEILRSGAPLPHSVALILDRDGVEGRAAHALAFSAAEHLAAHGRRVMLFCRQVQVAAWGLEGLYRRARAAGALVCRFESPPTWEARDGGLLVRTRELQSGAELAEIFATVIMPAARPETGRQNLGFPRALRRGPTGQLAAENVWLTSAQSNQPGIFIVGAARGNSELRAARNEAAAAAGAIHQWLGAGRVAAPRDAPEVETDKCVLCLTCLRACPHGAIRVDARKEAAAVQALVCRRCGICGALCPARAISLPWAADEQLLAGLPTGPLVTVLACENSAWPAADAAGAERRLYGSEVRVVRVPCAGRVEERQVLAALERGAARVLILGCHRQACRFLDGADRAARMVARLRTALRQSGLDPARVAVGELAEFETGRFLEYVNPTAVITTNGKSHDGQNH